MPNTMTNYGRAITANISTHTKHMTHYTVAIAFIEAHGNFAAITKDGLLALSWVNDGKPHEEGDVWHEEPMLFEADEDGMVVSREVRNWLGY